MSLQTYLSRLEDTIHSRQDITINELFTVAIASRAVFEASLQFYDDSNILVRETLVATDYREFTRLRHVYHYQDTNDKLIFRYDNSPHYPDLPTFPSHKHIGDKVIAADPPDLTDVLREIDALIYPKEET